jgi:Cu/Ag efflux pump CusA
VLHQLQSVHHQLSGPGATATKNFLQLHTFQTDLQAAVRYGAVQRLRPKFMTVATMFLGLVPIMWSTGTGADVMKRIAAPMIGGIFTSFVLELLVYPGLYQVWKWHFDLKVHTSEATTVRIEALQPFQAQD